MSTESKRRFLKYGLASVTAVVASGIKLEIDKEAGFEIGKHRIDAGMSKAQAACGSAYNCSGGGGRCGDAYNCSGGGGRCGNAYNCSGS